MKNIFVSYSHKDEQLKSELLAHLSALVRNKAIYAWHDRKIMPGADWATEIDDNVERSDIFIALVSSDFINSDYCYGKELRRALERHTEGLCIVVPIIVRSCDWTSTPLGKLQALPKDGRAVTSWTNQDEAFTFAAVSLRKLIEEIAVHP